MIVAANSNCSAMSPVSTGNLVWRRAINVVLPFVTIGGGFSWSTDVCAGSAEQLVEISTKSFADMFCELSDAGQTVLSFDSLIAAGVQDDSSPVAFCSYQLTQRTDHSASSLDRPGTLLGDYYRVIDVISQLANLSSLPTRNDAIDFVYDLFEPPQSERDLRIQDKILAAIDPSALHAAVTLSVLTATSDGLTAKLPSRKQLFEKSANHFRQTRGDDVASQLLDGLE